MFVQSGLANKWATLGWPRLSVAQQAFAHAAAAQSTAVQVLLSLFLLFVVCWASFLTIYLIKLLNLRNNFIFW